MAKGEFFLPILRVPGVSLPASSGLALMAAAAGGWTGLESLHTWALGTELDGPSVLLQCGFSSPGPLDHLPNMAASRCSLQEVVVQL